MQDSTNNELSEDAIHHYPPYSFSGNTLESLAWHPPKSPLQVAAHEAVKDIAYMTDEPPGCVLLGPPGVGKSMLAAVMLNEHIRGWVKRTEKCLADNPKVLREELRDIQQLNLWADWPALLRHLRESKAWWRDPAFIAACKAWVLVVDDLAAPRSETEREQFEALITQRWSHKPGSACGMGGLVLTTNMNAAQIRSGFGDRVIDRLRDGIPWLPMDGASNREPVTVESMAELRAKVAADVGD